MDGAINQNTFSFKYSAEENKEIQEIRNRYLPKGESKLDELKRLDAQVQNAGTMEALCIGIISCLVLGCGMCLAMQVIGNSIMTMLLGILIGIIGIAGVLLAYPVCRRKREKAKDKFASRILELTEELCQE